MPPPLSRAAGTTRRSATKASTTDASQPPGRAERGASNQLSKLEGIHMEYLKGQRASVLTLDKQHFKKIKSLTDSLSSKTKLLNPLLQKQVNNELKVVEIDGKMIKAFKQFSRKGGGDEFLGEVAE
eukprot:5953667-Pyramimonas_sp.AAC.1